MSKIVARTSPLRAAVRYLASTVVRYPWVYAVVAVSVSFFLVACAVSAWLGIPIRDPEGTLLGRRVVLPFIFMGIFFFIDVAMRARRVWSSDVGAGRMQSIHAVFVTRWGWRRITVALVGFMSFHLTYLSYRNLKSFLSLVEYETHDQQLLRVDRLMFLGHSPAPVLHDVLGTGFTAHALSTIYLAFIPFVPISIAAALTFSTNLRHGFVYLASAIFSWIFGTASYYLIPSLGPFAAATWQFDTLPATGVTRVQEVLLNQRLELHSDPIGGGDVASIAGFASLHVGIVFMAYLVARRYDLRALSWLCLAALVPTIIATIYFGWHYIVDDLAGFAIGWLSVACGVNLIYPPARLERVRTRLRRWVAADARAERA